MIKLSAIKSNPNNPRVIRDEKFDKLVNSIKEFPAMMELRPMIVNSEMMVLGGNMRLKALKEAGYSEVPESWVQSAESLTEEEQRRFIIADNVGFGEHDWGLLQSEWDIEELSDWGLDIDEVEPFKAPPMNEEGDVADEEQESGESVKIWVPDCLFASNNEFDIPTLNPHSENIYVELPLKPWGADSRTKTGVGTYHFYVDDYRFATIWDSPQRLIESGCKAIVEPNLSLYETTPISFGIFLIYKKRWISRFLQDYDINVFVDLNVTEKFMPYNILGIPEGYNAFFTRGYENRLGALKNELEIAKKISGLNNPNLIVYGGSKSVKEFCNENNLVFINNTTLDLKNG